MDYFIFVQFVKNFKHFISFDAEIFQTLYWNVNEFNWIEWVPAHEETHFLLEQQKKTRLLWVTVRQQLRIWKCYKKWNRKASLENLLPRPKSHIPVCKQVSRQHWMQEIITRYSSACWMIFSQHSLRSFQWQGKSQSFPRYTVAKRQPLNLRSKQRCVNCCLKNRCILTNIYILKGEWKRWKRVCFELWYICIDVKKVVCLESFLTVLGVNFWCFKRLHDFCDTRLLI